ncbi:MAG TPA: beta-ketoacyl reductase [Streptosporangiaceae bacterium]|nr:beta-ketoacyl reductase [Streptosporangiaceae bacterium]
MVRHGGVRESRHEAHLPHAALWGLGRVIAGECPELWGGTIDLDPQRWPPKCGCRCPKSIRAGPLTEQGLDSVMTVIVRRRLERRFGQSLPATLLWNQPALTAIAEHIMGLLVRQAGDALPGTMGSLPRSTTG